MRKIKLSGLIDSWGWQRSMLEWQLRDIAADEPIIMEVDSLGGDVAEAVSISNMLHERGHVTAHIIGFCASAATWLCYGCERVVINSDCAYLIHQCSCYVEAWGSMTSDEISTLIDKLKSEKRSNEAIDLIIASKYANHSGGKMDVKAALKLMKENRWMMPSEALDLGLVDEIADDHQVSKSNVARMSFATGEMGLPPLPATMTATSTEQKPSFAARAKKTLTDIFGGSVQMVADGPSPASPINTTMDQRFENVSSLLQAGSLQEADGRVSLSQEDMAAIDAALASRAADTARAERERDEARTALTEATAQINGISAEVASRATMAEKAAYISGVLSCAAGCKTETHAQLEGEGKGDYAPDPVNAVVARYRKSN